MYVLINKVLYTRTDVLCEELALRASKSVV